jgi:ClpX C4-type zinc finger protein
MPENFIDLDIDGSFIRAMRFVPSKSVDMSLLHAPRNKTEKQVTLQYDLHFHGAYGLRSNLNAQPWLEIESHDLVLHSEYLKEITEKRSGTSPESTSELSHFQLICDEGTIDIIAEYFTSSITDEIPVVGSFLSRQTQQTNLQIPLKDHLLRSSGLASDVPSHSPAPLDESAEIRCAFCGRERAEVAKIITGAEANICSDCVWICIALVKPTLESTE